MTSSYAEFFNQVFESTSVTLFRVNYPGVWELFRFFDGIVDQRRNGSAPKIGPSDYWHYTSEENYSPAPGYRLRGLGKSTDTLLPYWMTTKMRYDIQRRINVPVEWSKYPSKYDFHNMHEYEIIMGVALRHERRHVAETLNSLFDPTVSHAGRFEKVALNRPNLAWIYVDVTRDPERAKVIPPPGTRVRVCIWQDGVEPNLRNAWRGQTMAIATTSDSVILAESPPGARWAEGSRRVAIKAEDTAISINRMIDFVEQAVNHVHGDLPNGDACGRFDLHTTLLAHGPFFDPEHGQPVNLSRLVPTSDTDPAIKRLRSVTAKFTLDKSQEMAFDRSFYNLRGGLSLIQGPPGTGKSRVNACIATAAAAVGIKVLITAATNLSVQQLLTYIIEALESAFYLQGMFDVVLFSTPTKSTDTAVEMSEDLRDGATKPGQIRAFAELAVGLDSKQIVSDSRLLKYTVAQKIVEYVQSHRQTDGDCKRWWALRNNIVVDKRGAKIKDYQEFCDLNEKITKVILKGPKVKIVATTLNNSAHKALRSESYEPQLLIIDEACQSLEPENVIAMTFPSLRAVVLTGDQMQLAPTAVSTLGTRNPYAPQLTTALFTRLVARGYPLSKLRTNYRMHPDISRLPNRVSYHGELIDAPSTREETDVSRLWMDFFRSYPVFRPLAKEVRRIFINVAGLAACHPGSTSLHNPANIRMVQQLVWDLLKFKASNPKAKSRFDHTDIGVITPYTDEKRAILHDLAAASTRQDAPPGLREVPVTTVDGFQGHEAQVIILDLVAANETHPERIGFVGEKRRLNVSLTRAKQALIIIGNMDLWWPNLKNIRGPGNRPEFGELLVDVTTLGHQVNSQRRVPSQTPPTTSVAPSTQASYVVDESLYEPDFEYEVPRELSGGTPSTLQGGGRQREGSVTMPPQHGPSRAGSRPARVFGSGNDNVLESVEEDMEGVEQGSAPK